MAKCLVTGGCGFIGSHVVEALLAEGHEVVILDDLSTGTKWWVQAKIKGHEGVPFVHGDIRDPDIYGRIGAVDYVFHLGALARIQPSIEDPVGSNDVNLVGTLMVLEYCRKHKAKLIFSGSSSIYAGQKLPTAESDQKFPKNPYALQKSLAEQYIKLYKLLYGVDYAILRYFNVYGERQILEGAYAAVVGIFLDQVRYQRPITITNDGKQRRDFTYVKDVAQANLKAMDWTGIYNIGTGKNYSILDIAEAVGGKDYPIEFIGNRKGEAQATQADNSKALKKGWKPTKDIVEWINEAKS